MKQIVLLIAFLFSSGYLSIFAQKAIMDENAQVRQVGKFNALVVSSAFDVILTQSNETTVVVSAADAGKRDLIITEVNNGTLVISLKKSNMDWRGNLKLRAYISVPDLNKIELNGASDLKLEGTFKTQDFEVRLSGASDIAGSMEATNLRLTSSGSSDFKIDGKAENLRINLSGSSDVKAFDMVSDYCDISCSGSSDVEITVNKELKVNISGSSNVSYKGTAIVRDMKTSGSSSLKKRD
jgi:hypothetical protein